MLFDTPIYFVFLTLVVLLCWQLRARGQNVFLLIASYIFYGWWDWRFLFLMVASTAADYVIARRIEDTVNPLRRRWFLIASLVGNFAILGFFKYFNFFVDSAAAGLDVLGIRIPMAVLMIALPPGISFYTFQEVAYIVDVYKGRINASRTFVDYALFISLFPHLIAGPIQRPSHLLPQVQKPRWFQPEAFQHGCMLILTGLVRKTVIADNCALLANAAFSGRLGDDGWATLIGVYAFAFQIYGDFSGYSDIARGSAQLLGFNFMVNFRQPYLTTSAQDFWRRWHISLSTWLRDYLYIPLGGNRSGELSTYCNLMLTMLLGGLWHGANWTFVVWGAIHGAWLCVERLVLRGRQQVVAPRGWRLWIRCAIAFHVVCLAWIFFRATSLSSAVDMIGRLRHFQWSPDYAAAFLFLGILAGLALLIDWRLERTEEEYPFQRGSVWLRYGAVVASMLLMTLFSANESGAFIYFQF